jgi:hypothetical protein
MGTSHLEPARSVIGKIGIDRVAEVTGKHVSRVYRWMSPREKGGTDGVIPYSDATKLLAYAQQNGIALSPADFFVEPKENAASLA